MPRHNQAAYVYAIAYPGNEMTKIGIACDVGERLACLRSSEREPRLRVVGTWWCDRLAGSLEAILHHHLAAAKVAGERFTGPTDGIVGYVGRLFDAMPLDRVVSLYTEDRAAGATWPTERAYRLIDRALSSVGPYQSHPCGKREIGVQPPAPAPSDRGIVSDELARVRREIAHQEGKAAGLELAMEIARMSNDAAHRR